MRSVSLDDGKRDNDYSYFTDEIEEEAVKELVSPSLLFKRELKLLALLHL